MSEPKPLEKTVPSWILLVILLAVLGGAVWMSALLAPPQEKAQPVSTPPRQIEPASDPVELEENKRQQEAEEVLRFAKIDFVDACKAAVTSLPDSPEVFSFADFGVADVEGTPGDFVLGFYIQVPDNFGDQVKMPFRCDQNGPDVIAQLF